MTASACLQAHAVEAVLPMFRAAVEHAEEQLLQMHAVDWASVAEAAVLQPSGYMQRVAGTLRDLRARYLSHFVPQPSPSVVSFASLLCQRLASRLLSFFVRHAALIKALSQPGRLQLAKVRPSRHACTSSVPVEWPEAPVSAWVQRRTLTRPLHGRIRHRGNY
jgi:conserved oligomeric Golgi complex subunit 5